MIKLGVKKPYTILVAVIAVIVIGIVALTEMQTDLLPDIETPYLIVVTTYPGATPEKVEENVTKVMEAGLGTINGVLNVRSTSAENYSMVMLEFEDDTDMDAVLVKVSAAVNQVSGYLPETCGNPNILEISMNMLASIYTSVAYEGKDVFELSDFVEDIVVPQIERIDGVASVSEIGLVEQTVELRLNSDKIEDVNDRILDNANDKLKDAKKEIKKAQKELADARAEIEKQIDNLSDTRDSTAEELSSATLALNQAIATKAAYEANLTSLKASQTALQTELGAYKDAGVKDAYDMVNNIFSSTKAAVKQLEDTLGGYSPYSSEKLPGDINEAIEDPDKLDYFIEVAKAMTENAGSNGAMGNFGNFGDFGDLDMEKLADSDMSLDDLNADALEQLANIVETRIPQIETELANLEIEIQAAQAASDMVSSQMEGIESNYTQAEAGKISASAGFGSGDAKLSAALSAIEEGEAQLKEAEKSYKESVNTVKENANIDKLLTLDTLSGIIYAQNFSMPAGYIDDEKDNQWMLKVGENYENTDDLYDMVLCSIEGFGDVKLSDVADLTVIDNSKESYARVNHDPGVILAVYKSSTSGTSEVSDADKKTAEELMEKYPGLKMTPMVDQGDYIDIIIKSIVVSMVAGAGLAILILAVFLRDVMPTLVVAFSIPFSVITAIVIMYFTDISINMMSLSGLSLGIGMLVDNSIVVIENIYRLRSKGLTAPQASVHGTKQVLGAVIASTLTTICVFFPMVFTGGMVRSLMLPFALTISFALMASLIVSVTVVPTMGSVMLKKEKENKIGRVFEAIQNAYGKALEFGLRIKIIPLTIAIGLFGIAVYLIVNMGIVLIPDMNSDEISVSVTIPEDYDRDSAYALTDEVCDRLLKIEGVDFVGAMGASSGVNLLMGMSSGDNFYNYSLYVLPEEGVSSVAEINRIMDDIENTTKDLDCEVTASSNMMGSMSDLLGSGLSVELYGTDPSKLLEVSEDIAELVSEVEGFEEVSNGQEESDSQLHLIIDRDKAMGYTLTTAGIYQEIASRLTTEKTAVSLTIDDTDMDVLIVDETNTLTKENLLDMEFTVNLTDDKGATTTETHKLSEFARLETEPGYSSISRTNNDYHLSVTAATADGYNTTIQSRKLQTLLDNYKFPEGIYYSFGGETESVRDMLEQMAKLMALGALLVYLVMVAQFQSLLSPFIVIFTVPLAFTGGMFGLVAFGQQLSIISLLGFVMLMGTVVNNGIVFVDYVNQLRISGLERREALIQAGKVRMRPILMTAFTTILAMMAMVVGDDLGAQMSKGMAIVVAAGLFYATFMTLFIIPVLYDIMYKKEIRVVDVDDESIAAKLEGDII